MLCIQLPIAVVVVERDFVTKTNVSLKRRGLGQRAALAAALTAGGAVNKAQPAVPGVDFDAKLNAGLFLAHRDGDGIYHAAPVVPYIDRPESEITG